MPGWEHLQDVWRKVHNKRVREHFRDLVEDPDNDAAWNNFLAGADIKIPRQSLVLACMQSDGDTADMVILRTLLFWVVLGQASALHPPAYSIPSDRYQQMVRFAPQVTMYFKEDIADVEEGYAPIDAQISFRLMGESYDSVTQTELMSVATKIRAQFAANSGYRWQKGRVRLNYKKPEDGYFLQINAFSESSGRFVLDRVLDIQNKTIDESCLTINTPATNPPIVPPTERILGKNRRLPRKRPIGFVRFIYADVHVWGIPEAICLVDRSGRRRNPLIRA